ncbi:MAG: S41 family peptidase [Gemmatimonadaceae bacterium]
MPPDSVRAPKAPGITIVTIALMLMSVLGAACALEAQSIRGAPVRHDSALAVATVDSAWSRINRSYYDSTFKGIDWPALRVELRRRAGGARSMAEVRVIIESMFARLGESHFALIPSDMAAGWDDSLPPVPDDAFGEAGLEFRLLDGTVVVSRVRQGSAASDAGVGLGWEVEQVVETDVSALVHETAALPAGTSRRMAEVRLPLSLMARTYGAAGDSLALTFRSAEGQRVLVSVVLRAADAEVVRFGHLPPQMVRFESQRLADAQGCVGVVRFNVWMLPVMARIDDAMRELRGCRGIVLDLRGNVGGVAAMVMGVAGYFVDSTGSLGTLRSRAATLRYVTSPRRSDRHGRPLDPFAGPLAILVDELSASTSEIFAAGLQEMGRARLFGERTAGQALPAMLSQLPNGDVMEHVVADFTSPAGRRLEASGVVPDERIPLERGNLRAGRDGALLAARRWIDAEWGRKSR